MEKYPKEEFKGQFGPDYEKINQTANEFAKNNPTLREVFDFISKEQIPFGSKFDEETGKFSYISGIESEVVLRCLIGEKGINRVYPQLNEIMANNVTQITNVQEVDGRIVITAHAQHETWSEDKDEDGNPWRVTEVEFTEETLRGKSGRLQK